MIKLKLRSISFLTDEEVKLVSGGADTPGNTGGVMTECCPSWDSMSCETEACPVTGVTADCE
ncbi:hypothetical protein B9Y61_18885 [Stenotrophomonas maltophilia]|nr:hypothetical protein B9Y61_18885 [Stenotrophomonas maltophilia]